MRYFLLLLALSSCGPMDDWRQSNTIRRPTGDKIDPDLKQYVDDFTADRLEHQGYSRGKLIIAFANLPDPIQGECWTGGFIFIDKDYWERETCEARKKALIYHELGHCVMHLGHSDDEDTIMAPELTRCRVFENNWDSLVDDLFQYK